MKRSLLFTIMLLGSLIFADAVRALTLNLTAPKNGARFPSCSDITLKVEFDVPDENVRRVYFYQNGSVKGSIRQAPWEYVWEAVPDGIYEVYAKLTTLDGETIETDSIQLFVGPVEDGDKIINGEFACGTAPWTLTLNDVAEAELIYEEEGWLSDEPSMVYVDITNAGTANWHVMLIQNCPIDSGHTYHIYFMAEVEDTKSVGVDFQSTTGDYPVHFWQDVQVTSDEYEYGPVEFFCPVTDPSNQFKLALSAEPSGIFLDAIRVIDLNWEKNTTAVEHDMAEVQNFTLFQNYPNPFNPSTDIKFDIQNNEHVTLAVYNLHGQLVQTLVDEMRSAGTHSVTWNGRNAAGQSMPSGIYIYQLQTGSFSSAKRMVLLK